MRTAHVPLRHVDLFRKGASKWCRFEVNSTGSHRKLAFRQVGVPWGLQLPVVGGGDCRPLLFSFVASSHMFETIKKKSARWSRPRENHATRVEGENHGRQSPYTWSHAILDNQRTQISSFDQKGLWRSQVSQSPHRSTTPQGQQFNCY